MFLVYVDFLCNCRLKIRHTEYWVVAILKSCAIDFVCFHILKTLGCVDPRVIGATSFIFVHPVIEKSALFNPSPFSYYIPLYEMFKQHYPTILLLDYYEKVD